MCSPSTALKVNYLVIRYLYFVSVCGDLLERHVYDKRLCGYASRCQFPLFPSTKSGFLCAFRLRNPHFRAFRAQNRGVCAFLAFATLVFGLFEHKIEVFVRFASSIFATAAPASNKPHQAEKYSGLASTLAYLGRMWLPPGRGAAAGWQMVLPDCAARKNLPLRCAGETAAAPETAARKRQSCAGDYELVPQRRSRCEGSAIGKLHGAIGKMRGATIGKPQGTIGKPQGTIGKQEKT